MKRAVVESGIPTLRRYVAQQQAGERPFNTIAASEVTEAALAAVDEGALGWYQALADAPVLLVIGVDLRLVASIDASLDRVGVVSGASVYPFVQNTILAAHARGLAGVLTTFAIGAEDRVKQLLGLPSYVALAAIVPLGHPTKVLTKLTRHPVEEFARWESWDGPPVRTP
jgi:nitroreductase